MGQFCGRLAGFGKTRSGNGLPRLVAG